MLKIFWFCNYTLQSDNLGEQTEETAINEPYITTELMDSSINTL